MVVDISVDYNCKPQQPTIIFPRHKIGNKYRAFAPALYKVYPWIEYSIAYDAVFCFYCRHFSMEMTSPFVEGGFRLWKKCYGSDPKGNRLLQHKTSSIHMEAVAAYNTFTESKIAQSSNCSVRGALSKAHRTLVEGNRHYIRTLSNILLFTAKRKISQRESSSADFDNRGNFLSLLALVAKHDSLIAERIKAGPKNAKYTHHNVQNALLEIMAQIILEEIQNEVQQAGYYSILADESKDVSKKEQVSLAVRYVYEGCIHEEFIGMHEAQSLDANGLANTIIQHVTKLTENLTKCVGQGYDGAAVVAGHLNGVNAIIRSIAPTAFYVHCFSHRLNLVIVDVMKSVQWASATLALLQRLYEFVSGSHVHAEWIALQKKMNLKVLELKRLIDIRWACQSAMVTTVSKRITPLYFLLSNISSTDKNSSRATDAKGLLLQLDRKFICRLLVLQHILQMTRRVSDFLQNPANSLGDAIQILQNLRDNIQAFRTDEDCRKSWDDAQRIVEEIGIPEVACPQRSRTLPSRLRDSIVDAPVENCNTSDKFADFKRQVNEVTDRILSELERRFDGSNAIIMQAIAALTPKCENFLNEELIFPFADLYGLDSEGISLELKNWKRFLARQDFPNASLLEHQSHVHRLRDAFPDLDRLLTIACTLPVSTCECERSFSTLRLVKSYLRSTMSNNRLHNLMILGVHSIRAQAIDLNCVVDLFMFKFPNCCIALS